MSFLYEDRCSRSILREHALQLWRMADTYEVAKLSQCVSTTWPLH
jgi:hypothetical protein